MKKGRKKEGQKRALKQRVERRRGMKVIQKRKEKGTDKTTKELLPLPPSSYVGETLQFLLSQHQGVRQGGPDKGSSVKSNAMIVYLTKKNLHLRKIYCP